MQKQTRFKPSYLPCRLPTLLYPLLFISLITIITVSSKISYPHFTFTFNTTNTTINVTNDPIVLPYSIHKQFSNLQNRMGVLLEELHSENPESKAITKFADHVLGITLSLDKLMDNFSHLYGDPPINQNEMSNVDEDLSESEDSEVEEGSLGRKIFSSRELHNYTSPKPNKQGGKNFLGVEAVYLSIGLGCARMPTNLDRFMAYKVYGLCPDDWIIGQKLMVGGCEPLPRRRCFSISPPHYSKPLPTNSSLWSQPSEANILWNHYKCKDYTCLASNKTIGKRGFFKCSDCFDLSKQCWVIPSNELESAEFTVDEVLRLKPGEIRIGLDYSPTTGTFAAIMKENNVTIASATLNLGAPFNEVIALRGLLPLYVSIGSRFPFFDNTLDIVHTTLFLDWWIGLELLQYVLFDWDRILRPKGLLWVDCFFYSKEDIKLYLDEFTRLVQI